MWFVEQRSSSLTPAKQQAAPLHVCSPAHRAINGQQLMTTRQAAAIPASLKSEVTCPCRGLDIPGHVDHIVNFDFPRNPVDYIHRSGRTARAGQQGQITSLVYKGDQVSVAYELSLCLDKSGSTEITASWGGTAAAWQQGRAAYEGHQAGPGVQV